MSEVKEDGSSNNPLAIYRWILGIGKDIDDMHAQLKPDGTPRFTATGNQFLVHMVAMYIGIRGFMDSGSYQATGPILQKIGMDTGQGNSIISTMRLPWSLKCIYAMLSDGLAVFNYKKRWYMLIATIAGSVSLFALAFLPYETLVPRSVGEDGFTEFNGTFILSLLLMVNVMASLDDALTQGKYTEIAKAKGGSVIVMKSMFQSGAGFVVSMYAGFLNDAGASGPQWLFLSALPWAIFACIPIMLNLLGDERLDEAFKCDNDLLRNHYRLFVLAIALGGCTFINIGMGMSGRSDFVTDNFTPSQWRTTRMATVNFLMVGVLAMTFWSLDRTTAKINVYLYLCRLCTFGMGYPLQQFYTMNPADCELRQEDGSLLPPGVSSTADEEAYRMGTVINTPNFPFFLYTTIGGICSTSATMFALYLFENYVVHWKAPRAFWVTTAFQVIAGCFDIVNTTRTNQRIMAWTGLGDVIWYFRAQGADGVFIRPVRMDDVSLFLLGGSLLEPLIDTLDSLPSTLLLSKLCPKGVETTVFAILAGFSNVGLSVSGLMGSSALDYFGFVFSGKSASASTVVPPRSVCQFHSTPELDSPTAFHGMARALIAGNMVLPFFTILLTWFFIPDIRLDEDFLDDGGDEMELGEGGGEVPFNPATDNNEPVPANRSAIVSRSGFNQKQEMNWVESRASIVSGVNAKTARF